MGIETIGTGLKTILEGISGLRVFAPNELPDSIPEFPAALILPGETNYEAAMGGDYDWTLRVLILLGKQDTPSAFNEILDYIEPTGAKSVITKVKADPTLDSSCDTSRVIRNLGVGATMWGGIAYLSTEFEIAIYA